MSRRHTRSDELRAAQAERFAARLADHLYELGLTHKDIAQALSVPVGTVDSWTRGSDPKIPSEPNFAALCALLDERKPGAGVSLAEAAGRSWSPPVSAGGIESEAATEPLDSPTLPTLSNSPDRPVAATAPLEPSLPHDATVPLTGERTTVQLKPFRKAFLVPAAIALALLVFLAGALLMQGQGGGSTSAGKTTPTVMSGGSTGVPGTTGTSVSVSVSAAVQEGERLLGERKAEQALAAYKIALASEPRNAQALLGMGRALFDLERYEEAVDSLSSALSTRPGDPTTLLVRAHVYLKMAYWQYAGDDAARVLELDKASLDAMLVRAHARAGAGAWPLALVDYAGALKAYPNNPAIYLDRGEAYLEHGDVAQAIADFNQARAIDPRRPDALVALGRAYLTGDSVQPNRALEFFSRAIESDPQNSSAYYWRGFTYLEYRAIPASARDDFTQAIELGPANSRIHHARAHSEELLGDLQAQLSDLDRAVALDPKNPVVYHRRYQYFYWNLDYDRALNDLNAELEGEGDSPTLYVNRSELYLLLDNAAQAEADARRAVGLAPDYALPYVALAHALSIRQKYTDALAEAERAVRANDPDNHVEALSAKGWVELKLGQAAQAAADFEEALRSEPLERTARFGRASLAIDNRRFADALNDIEVGIGQYDRYGLGYVLRARVWLAQDKPDSVRADLAEARKRILYPDERAQVDALLAQVK